MALILFSLIETPLSQLLEPVRVVFLSTDYFAVYKTWRQSAQLKVATNLEVDCLSDK